MNITLNQPYIVTVTIAPIFQRKLGSLLPHRAPQAPALPALAVGGPGRQAGCLSQVAIAIGAAACTAALITHGM